MDEYPLTAQEEMRMIAFQTHAVGKIDPDLKRRYDELKPMAIAERYRALRDRRWTFRTLLVLGVVTSAVLAFTVLAS